MAPFVSGSRLSKQSADFMERLSEHPSEEFDGEASKHLGSAESTTGHEKEQSESSSFSLARLETQLIYYSKVVLLVVVFIFAAVMGYLTYYVVHEQEKSDYHVRVSFVSHRTRLCPVTK